VLSTGVEQRVSVVHETEKDGQSFFQIGKGVDMLGVGHLLLLVVGSLMALFLLLNPATDI